VATDLAGSPTKDLVVTGMKTIKLTRGMVALVDDEDYEYVNAFKWHAVQGRKTFYASRSEYNPRRRIPMHLFILGFPNSEIDHRDRNGLNNTRKNLRPASRAQNKANTAKFSTNKSGFKGVSYCPWLKKRQWAATINSNNVRVNLGYFTTPEEAARAYDAKARELHREFAWLNFPEKQES
jgi:hypothetical protein